MSFPSQEKIDVIATQILLDAKQALATLKGWNNSITDAQEKVKLFRELIKATAAQMNGDMKAATSAVQRFSGALNINPAVVSKIGKDLQTLDAIAQKSLGDVSMKSMEGSARMTLLANAIQMMSTRGKVAIDQVVSSLRTLNASTGTQFGKLGFSDADISRAGQIASQTAAQVKKVGDEGDKAGKKTKSAFDQVFSSVNAVRIALGAIVSMILFNVIQAFQQLATDSVKQFTEMEDALWRINVAERELSKQGQDISVAGLKKGIEDIKKLLPIFSEQDISGLVGKVSISTKELGYTEDQIIQLSKAIAVLNVVSTENEDLNATAGKVITALLSGTTKGVSGLGVQLNDTVIKQKAVEMGFISVTESVDDLSKKEKDLAKLAIVLGTANGSLDLMDEYMTKNVAKIKENSAGWDDLKTAIGGFTSAAIPALSGFFELLTDATNSFKALVVIFDVAKGVAINFFMALTSGMGVLDGIQKGLISFKDIPAIFDAIAKKEIPQLFAKMPSDAPKWFKDLFGKYITDVETATDLTAKFKNEITDDEDVLKALADIEKGVQDIVLDAQQARADLDIKLKQKQEDLDKEYERKNEDAAREHNQKLSDINLDTQRKLADAKTKAREDERKGEEELLQKLKELRDKYLLDLEEALHARDARQVLRLMKEYQLDKQNLLDRKKLDDQQRKEKLADDLKAIELERKQRIEDENLRYKRELADLALAKSREQQELQIWYQREQQDIQRNIQEKLQKLLAGYIAEGKIHESEQAKIYGILAKYFGMDMALVDQMAQFMATRFAQMGQFTPAPVGSLNYNLGLPNMSNPFAGGVTVPGFAEGGSMIANKPTVAMFGEKGAEMATFTPISKMKGSQSFGDLSGAGVNGTIHVSVDLSPDLEGRIVNRSMDKVANVIGKVNRKKL